MNTIYQKLKDLKTKSTSKSITKFITSIIITRIYFYFLQKRKTKPETWQFTKLVNATLDNNGYMVTLRFLSEKR
jgi:hypothetical protein